MSKLFELYLGLPKPAKIILLPLAFPLLIYGYIKTLRDIGNM